MESPNLREPASDDSDEIDAEISRLEEDADEVETDEDVDYMENADYAVPGKGAVTARGLMQEEVEVDGRQHFDTQNELSDEEAPTQ